MCNYQLHVQLHILQKRQNMEQTQRYTSLKNAKQNLGKVIHIKESEGAKLRNHNFIALTCVQK